LLKEKIVNIITVKAVRNIPICVKSLSVMYTASPPFKVLSHFGRWIDRLTSKVSLVNILAYYRGKCNFINSRSQDWVKINRLLIGAAFLFSPHGVKISASSRNFRQSTWFFGRFGL